MYFSVYSVSRLINLTCRLQQLCTTTSHNNIMDEFAQTGAQQDDLFDDIQYAPGTEESMQTRAPDALFGEEFTPAAEPIVEIPSQPAAAAVASAPPPNRGRGGRGRGGPSRGRGRDGPRPRGPVAQQQQQQQQKSTETRAVPATSTTVDTQIPSTSPAPLTGSRHNTGPLSDSRHSTGPLSESRHNTAPPPSEPSPSISSGSVPTAAAPTEAPKHTNTARGDRRATGGLQKAKLTPEELEAKMKSMSLRSAELTERHQRAEADRASFDKREEVAKETAKQRTKEERRDRQQMMGEREKNRLRKLKAMEGREWDAEKQEDDYAPRNKAFGRGAHGGVVGQRDSAAGGSGGPGRDQDDYDDGREYLYREPRGRGRGRGGAGGRGAGAGGGRGGARGAGGQQNAPKHSDFPELPAAGTTSVETAETTSAPALTFPKKTVEPVSTKDVAESPAADTSAQFDVTATDENGKSWADMVESAT